MIKILPETSPIRDINPEKNRNFFPLTILNWKQSETHLIYPLTLHTISGTSVQFQNRFPSELDSRIDRQTFERTIAKVNEYFLEAEKGNCSTFCEGFCACFTAFLIYIFTETHYEKVSRLKSMKEKSENP